MKSFIKKRQNEVLIGLVLIGLLSSFGFVVYALNFIPTPFGDKMVNKGWEIIGEVCEDEVRRKFYTKKVLYVSDLSDDCIAKYGKQELKEFIKTYPQINDDNIDTIIEHCLEKYNGCKRGLYDLEKSARIILNE